MDFCDDEDRGICPFNQNHIFEKDKLLFHLNRCKDRQKSIHLFATCPFNAVHIIRKDDMQTHEIICPDKEEMRNLTSSMLRTSEGAERERQRSREKLKRENREGEEEVKGELKKEDRMEDYVMYENCGICRRTVATLEEIKAVVGSETLAKIKLLEKLIAKNDQIMQIERTLKGTGTV